MYWYRVVLLLEVDTNISEKHASVFRFDDVHGNVRLLWNAGVHYWDYIVVKSENRSLKIYN